MKYALLLGIWTAVSTIATAQDAPNPRDVTIRNIGYSGTGCPQGTVADMISNDGKAFTLFFSDFSLASQARGVLAKTCALRISVDVPRAFEYALSGIDYRGYMDIGEKTHLKLSARTNSKNGHGNGNGNSNGGEKLFDVKYKGPKADEFFIPVQPGGEKKWSGCGENARGILLVTEARLMSATGNGAIVTFDSLDGDIQQRVGISWRRCGNRPNGPQRTRALDLSGEE